MASQSRTLIATQALFVFLLPSLLLALFGCGPLPLVNEVTIRATLSGGGSDVSQPPVKLPSDGDPAPLNMYFVRQSIHPLCEPMPFPRHACSARAEFAVLRYFTCGYTPASRVNVCIVNNVSALIDTPAMAMWQPAARRIVPVNRAAGLIGPSASYVLQLSNAVVDGATGAVFTPDMYIRADRSYLRPPSNSSEPKRPARRVGKLVTIALKFCETFQHFMFDCLPRLDLVADLLLSDPEIYLLYQGPVTLLRVLQDVMGPSFAASRFINADPDHVYPANSVWFPFYDIRVDSGSTMGFVPHGAASLFSGPRLRIPPPPTGRRSVLYVGRPESVLRRYVVNEFELLDATRAMLAPLGYTLEVMTDPRHWRADRYVFSRAVLMFGPHGGAFSNMIFLQPGTPVVEFLSKSNSTRYKPRNCYAGMAAGLGLPFWRYNPPVFGYRDPMVVEIDAVLAMLKRTGALPRLPPIE